MVDDVEFQELSDEELGLVVGGYKNSPHGKVEQQNNVLTLQYANAQGFVATALNVNVVTPVNVAITIDV